MSDPRELLDATPFDDELRLVVADQLQRLGDPQGELAIVQRELASSPSAELRAREETLLAEVAPGVPSLVEADVEQVLGVTWRLGWIDHVRLLATGWPDREAEVAARLEALLANPAARFVEHLELAIGHWKRDVIFDDLLAILVERGPYPALRTLAIGNFIEFRDGQEPYVTRDLSAVYITNRRLAYEDACIGRMSRLCPNLEEVRLQGNVAQLGRLVLPRARVFEVCTSALGKEALAGLAGATWPSLERLVLWFGDGEYGYGDPCDPDEVAQLVRGLETRCPRLHHLALANSPWADEILEDLAARSPLDLLARLTGFDLSLGTLGNAGAEQLIKLRPYFTSLTALDVTHNYIEPSTFSRLRAAYAPCIVAGGPCAVAVAPGERYCSVGE